MRSSEAILGRARRNFLIFWEKNKADVEKVIWGVKGFVSYSLVRTDGGGVSVTVCQDKTGTDESVRAARDWIVKNGGNVGAAAPTVSEGAVILQLK